LRADLTAEPSEWIATRCDDDYRFMAKFCDRPLTKREQEWKHGETDGENQDQIRG
jgi:hypothetical protein